jgi:hypothetical protein
LSIGELLQTILGQGRQQEDWQSRLEHLTLHIRLTLMNILHALAMTIGSVIGSECLGCIFGTLTKMCRGLVDPCLLYEFGIASMGLTPEQIEGSWSGSMPPAERVWAYRENGLRPLIPGRILQVMAKDETAIRAMRDAGIPWKEIALAVAANNMNIGVLREALRIEGWDRLSILRLLGEMLADNREVFSYAMTRLGVPPEEVVLAFARGGTPMETLFGWLGVSGDVGRYSRNEICGWLLATTRGNDTYRRMKLGWLRDQDMSLEGAALALRQHEISTNETISDLVAAGYTDIADYQALRKDLIVWPTSQEELIQIGIAFARIDGVRATQIISFLRERGLSTVSAVRLLDLAGYCTLDPVRALFTAGFPEAEAGTLDVRKTLLGGRRTMTPREFKKLWAQVAPPAPAAPPTES